MSIQVVIFDTNEVVARIHEGQTGRYYITNDALPHLEEFGQGYPTRGAAIAEARNSEVFTHYIRGFDTVVKL